MSLFTRQVVQEKYQTIIYNVLLCRLKLILISKVHLNDLLNAFENVRKSAKMIKSPMY